MPTVLLPAELVVAHAEELIDMDSFFWIFLLDDAVLIDCPMDGEVTVAAVPSQTES